MNAQFLPRVSPEIFDLRRDYCALSIVALGVDNSPVSKPRESWAETKDWLGRPAPAWAEAHFESWRAAYRAFGAKPQRTPSSAEALRKRLDAAGELPAVNPTVDLYNALSVRYAVPVGGESICAYHGLPRLIRARGEESFDTLKDGGAYSEQVPAGEVIWCDDRGATCRRWNWRQGVRTRIDEATRDVWFVLERLEPMPISALLEAGGVLITAITRQNPGARLESALIDQSGVTPSPAMRLASSEQTSR
jgi:DNA/RNA-binding domain of Phe-tRNA-synthetase-like protein